ncbi:ROK family protein [Leifsonia sp. L25]|uniref:ROK family protein n=1 Tax=Leifsonia sp. L25 TaxID=3423957 RepID=UPI003D6813B7
MTTDATIDTLPTHALADGSGTLLQLVRSGRASTISELAAAMGVSRSTAIQRIDFLVAHGLIASQAAVAGSRGRPAALARFNPGAGIVLAAQIGISGCRIAATDLAGAVLAEGYLTVELATGPHALLTDLEDAFDRMRAGLPGTPVVGMGVGIPNDIELANYARGLGLSGTGWDREYFRSNLREHFDAPVFVDLDVNLIALAEWRKSWPDVEVFVCVKLGTLLNAAIIVNGVPVRGVSGLAGELGHIKVNGATEACSCGGVGCLDAVASGSALVRQLAEAGLDVEHVSDVVRLAQQAEPRAVHAVREAGRRIGEALASVVNLLNPAVIATWGYLTEAETPLFAGMREGVYQMALPGSSERLTLERASLGDLAGARGAAMRVIDEVLDPAAVDRMLVAGSWSAAWPEATQRAAS